MKISAWRKYFRHGRRRSPSSTGRFDNNTLFDLSRLSVGQVFGEGADSRIYHGMYNDMHVAVKVIQVHDQEVDKERCLARLQTEFDQESSLLSSLHHPNVLKFVGAFRQEDVFCIVTEYMSEGSLRSYLNKLRSEGTRLTLPTVLVLALEIARGMEYVHSQGIIHRDLKPENVLIGDGFGLKIADFGVSCEDSCSEIPESYVGTYRWMAPEMIKRKKSCNRKVDVYSFGLVLFEMISGSTPFADMIAVQVAYAVANKNPRLEIPNECPDPMKALIEHCCSSKPKNRPDFRWIVSVLEKFIADLAHDGTLKLVQDCIRQNNDHKMSFLRCFTNPNSQERISEISDPRD